MEKYRTKNIETQRTLGYANNLPAARKQAMSMSQGGSMIGIYRGDRLIKDEVYQDGKPKFGNDPGAVDTPAAAPSESSPTPEEGARDPAPTKWIIRRNSLRLEQSSGTDGDN